MTTPTHVDPVRANSQMTQDRWRAVDAILKIALACAPEDRESVIADACEGDAALRNEVDSLLAAHVDTGDAFLEVPAAATMALVDSTVLADRLARALTGRYAIERELARGGMATVYLARDLRHGRLVAIKVLRDEVAAAVGADRFLAEIRVTASLQHPHILPLFDSGSADGLLWYAMPFVEGETLRAYLVRAGSLPVAEAVRLAREVGDALEYAHLRGIVHRDVKPENVLIQDGHAVVADFGIALALEQAGSDRITRTGLALGTPQYMAPEQAAGERVLDARVDVYALGAVLHEMLAGETPFAAPSRQAVVRRMMNEDPPSLTIRRPEVTSYVDATVRRALAKRPEDRFPTAAAFTRALATAVAMPLHDPTPARAESDGNAGGSRRGRTVSARGAFYAACAMLAVGLVAGRFAHPLSLLRQLTDPSPAMTPPMNRGRANVSAARVSNLSLAVLDRAGRVVNVIPAERPWTPRFSPDGHSVAYGAFGAGQTTSDLWVTNLDAGTTKRLTNDDGDANDPQWSADGARLAYSVGDPGGKNVVVRSLAGGAARNFARDGTQFPSDWLRNGSALLVTEEAGNDRHDIIVQPADGSAAKPYIATGADETAARISPDGRWVAYTSDESGQAEVYFDSYSQPGRGRVKVSLGGGVHPVWRGDGRELFYWRDGALVAVSVAASVNGAMPLSGEQTVLFRARYEMGYNTMYDVSPDGQRFVIVRQP
ncbi:MAG: serine/threonine-protein kinase [Gemmatimonadota bacterium]|nr:serine/threonine-protein kinase [Gemmatimonadota bacterium]